MKAARFRERTTAAERAFARADLVAIVAVVTVLLFAWLPAFAQAKSKATRVLCLEHLHQIGRAFRSYAVDHAQRFPMEVRLSQGGTSDYLGSSDTTGQIDLWTHYAVLSNQLVNPATLVCPSDTSRYVATDFTDFGRSLRARNAALSYGLGTGAREALPRMLLAADRSLSWPGGRVLFEYSNKAVRGNVGTNAAALQTLGWDAKALHVDAGNALRVDGSTLLLNSQRLREALLESGDAKNTYAQPGKTAVQ